MDYHFQTYNFVNEIHTHHGWVEYVAFENPIQQYWLLSPGGDRKLIDSENINEAPVKDRIRFDAVGPGEIAYKKKDGLYLKDFNDSDARMIASAYAHAFPLNGVWHLMENGSLFSVNGTIRPSLGDVDGNGKVEVGDAVLILQSVVTAVTLLPEQAAAADVDKNTLIDVRDAVKVLRVLVGLEAPLADQ